MKEEILRDWLAKEKEYIGKIERLERDLMVNDIKTKGISPPPLTNSMVEQHDEYRALKQNFEELAQEFCQIKIDKVHLEHEVAAILTCVEGLCSKKQASDASIRQSLVNVSDKSLARLATFFREKHFKPF